MNRSFTAEEWTNLIPRKLWYEAVDEANSLIDDDIEVDIQGYDIDGEVVKAARENAREAGVEHLIISGAGSKGFKTSKEVWIYHHQPSIWRET